MRGAMGRNVHHLHLLQGGRLTKYRGKVATIAPALLALAVAAPVLLSAPAAQAACTVAGNTATCSGTDNTTQNISLSGNALVDIQPGYSVTANVGDGLDITTDAASTRLTIQDDATNPSTIKGKVFALQAVHRGTGNVIVELHGDLTGTGSNDALRVDNTSSGNYISVLTYGTLFGNTNHGIHVEQNSAGGGGTYVQALGDVTGNTLQGIIVKGLNAGNGNIDVVVGSRVWSQ